MRSPTRTAIAVLCASLCSLAATAALAHGGRLPLDQWGGFDGGLLRCQRVIARAAAQCATGAWAARRACREAAQGCDDAATRAHIAAVRRTAQDEIDAACGERQAIDLQYLGSFDLHDDVVTFCRGWEVAADSGVFGGGHPSGPCTAAAADAATEVMRHALRGRRRCMDRVAASRPGSGERAALLAGAERRLVDTIERTTRRLAARCADFTARYGRSPRAFVETLATRADCVGGAFYIQDRVLCPPPVCGNGIVEPTEECDDGNTADGDTCPSTCTR